MISKYTRSSKRDEFPAEISVGDKYLAVCKDIDSFF